VFSLCRHKIRDAKLSENHQQYIMAMNGTAAPTTATRLTANALARLMEEKPDSATFQPVLQIAGALLFCRE